MSAFIKRMEEAYAADRAVIKGALLELGFVWGMCTLHRMQRVKWPPCTK